MQGKILITGGAGYIGSHMTHYLVAKGYNPENLITFDNLRYGHSEYLPDGVNFVQGDLLKQNQIEKVFIDFDIHAVYHFAAYAYVHESMQNPDKYFRNNIIGGLNLLETMHKHNCTKIVFSSTCATYGIPETIPITEDTPQEPVNPYGESKLIFERILKWYDEIYDIKSISLRYFNVGGADFGIGENHEPETHLIPLTIFTALKKNEYLQIHGTDYHTPDGTCVRDFIHVTDLVDAHLSAMDYLLENNKSDAFNLGTGSGTSVKEIINFTGELTNIKIEAVESCKREGDPAILIASSEKANNVLHWRVKNTLQDIIASSWEWYIKLFSIQ
jgi:UDP-glucose-4-epimerase GalE